MMCPGCEPSAGPLDIDALGPPAWSAPRCAGSGISMCRQGTRPGAAEALTGRRRGHRDSGTPDAMVWLSWHRRLIRRVLSRNAEGRTQVGAGLQDAGGSRERCSLVQIQPGVFYAAAATATKPSPSQAPHRPLVRFLYPRPWQSPHSVSAGVLAGHGRSMPCMSRPG